MPFAISLTDYKMSHPDAAEYPTLSQSGLLAALLETRRYKVACLAHRRAKRHARRQAVRAWLGRWWTKLRGKTSPYANPVFAAVGARNV